MTVNCSFLSFISLVPREITNIESIMTVTQGDASVPRLAFRETLDKIPDAMADLLATYSGIDKKDQLSHAVTLRDSAYARFPFPCLGTFRFLELDLATSHGAYKDHVLAPLCREVAPGEPEPLFLDVGTCLGQDIRKLSADGVPQHRLWGSDIDPGFIDVGYQFFKDVDKFPRDHFLTPGDLLRPDDDASSDPLARLDDKVTILGITAVFHLFDIDDQKRIAQRILKLLRKDTGAPVLVLGAQLGSAAPMRKERRIGKLRYQHNNASWNEFWQDMCALPQWRDAVEKVEVKSALYSLTERNVGNARSPIVGDDWTAESAKAAGMDRLWQEFEVWITFKS
ncbi:hypothetical protein F5Y18DRAFT_404917 [Xylariaceae sp. FL1019]|nr:hypothetical protein F5Y18DRAFT_404917 [Xylariaceae sp. FL1019]